MAEKRIDQLLEQCTTPMPARRLRTLGNGILTLGKVTPHHTTETFFGDTYDRTRQYAWYSGLGGTTLNVLKVYAQTQQDSNEPLVGPAMLVVAHGEETPEGLTPYSRFICRPNSYLTIHGSGAPARLIVIDGLVDAETHLSSEVIEAQITSAVQEGIARPKQEDFARFQALIEIGVNNIGR